VMLRKTGNCRVGAEKTHTPPPDRTGENLLSVVRAGLLPSPPDRQVCRAGVAMGSCTGERGCTCPPCFLAEGCVILKKIVFAFGSYEGCLCNIS